MEDLSHLFTGGPVSALVPTGQNSADSRPQAGRAMTAPGGEPADGVAENEVPAPDVAASGAGVDRRLTRGTDDGLHGGRPVLRMGQWNEVP